MALILACRMNTRFEKETPAWPWILLLMAVHVAVYINSSSMMDTARDIYYAWNIAQLQRFPLEGPALAGVLHLGPAWFYVLSVPLLFSSSWMGVVLWLGLISALRYPLAYLIGRRLAGKPFGLLFAALCALPGWNIFTYLVINHISVVETATLFALYCLVAWRTTGRPLWLMLTPLALVLGIHAHPTVYVVALIACAVLAVDMLQGRLAWRWLLSGLVLGVLPIAPWLVSQTIQGWPELDTSAGYLASQSVFGNLAGIPRIVQGILIDGPIAAYRVILDLGSAGTVIAWLQIVLFGGGILATAYAAIRRGPDAVTARVIIASWMTAVAGVALIRSDTMYYLTLVLYPFTAGAAAYGLTPLRPANIRFACRALPAVASVVVLTILVRFLTISAAGNLQHPSRSAQEIKRNDLTPSETAAFFPAWGRASLAKLLCATEEPVTVHGNASVVLDQSYGLETRMRCGKDELYIAGQAPGRHFVGLRRVDARILSVEGGINIGSLRVIEAEGVFHPNDPVGVPRGDVYPPRPYMSASSEPATVTVPARPGEWLAVTNPYLHWMNVELDIRLDGQPVVPRLETRATVFFRCDECRAETENTWHIEITSPAPEYVDVVTFRDQVSRR